MSDSFQRLRELRDQLIRAVYDLRDPNTGQVMANAIMQRIGLRSSRKTSEVARGPEAVIVAPVTQGPG